MKKIFFYSLLFLTFINIGISSAFAGYVNGYYRSNGTYVNGYYRTDADSSPYNNYSYPGNYNPNTGNITGGSQSGYLERYYNNTSGYNSYSPSYLTAPTVPTCPLNSYYDGVSSCKCNYGYSVSGSSCVSNSQACTTKLGYLSTYNSLTNTCECMSGYTIGKDVLGNATCVSQEGSCTDQFGYGSTYNSLKNKCECRTGYVVQNNKCVTGNSYCSQTVGIMSTYNTLTSTCECLAGYQFDGTSCKYKPTNNNLNSCPINSHQSVTDSTKCTCDTGYQANSSNNGCELTTVVVKNTYYTNTNGIKVKSPSYSATLPAGATAKCGDGTYSYSLNHRGTCSHHGGVSSWLK